MFANDHVYLELTETAEGAWRVSDARVPEEDPLHVVAFIESRGEVLDVVWVRGSIVAPGSFEDLGEALDAIDDVLTTGEIRGPLVQSTDTRAADVAGARLHANAAGGRFST